MIHVKLKRQLAEQTAVCIWMCSRLTSLRAEGRQFVRLKRFSDLCGWLVDCVVRDVRFGCHYKHRMSPRGS